jgi:hypothetical protein
MKRSSRTKILRVIKGRDLTRPRLPTALKRRSNGAITCAECEKPILRGRVYSLIDDVAQCESCKNKSRLRERNRRRVKPPRPSIGKIDARHQSDGFITCNTCEALVPKGDLYRLTTRPPIGEVSCMSCWVEDTRERYKIGSTPQPEPIPTFKPKRNARKRKDNKGKKKQKPRVPAPPLGNGRRARFWTGRKHD